MSKKTLLKQIVEKLQVMGEDHKFEWSLTEENFLVSGKGIRIKVYRTGHTNNLLFTWKELLTAITPVRYVEMRVLKVVSK